MGGAAEIVPRVGPDVELQLNDRPISARSGSLTSNLGRISRVAVPDSNGKMKEFATICGKNNLRKERSSTLFLLHTGHLGFDPGLLCLQRGSN